MKKNMEKNQYIYHFTDKQNIQMQKELSQKPMISKL